ncbi:MAG: ATP-binding cassette domain-containing protein, partial [Thermoanaerobaculia bacterium]
IAPMLRKNIAHLSKGFKQRVGLAQAMIHDPPILILDEPTSGLDPHQIIEIRGLIRELGKSKVIILSSHILQEISAICTRIIIIKEGRVIADGTPNDLQGRIAGGNVWRARIQGPAEAVKSRLRSLAGVASADLVGSADGFAEYRVRAGDGQDLGPEIFRAAKEAGWTLSQLDLVSRSLEDVYLQLTEQRAAS